MADKKKEVKKTIRCKKGSYYKIDGDKLIRLKKTCPKCGSGVFLAEHKDRYVCGSCAYTEWKKKD